LEQSPKRIAQIIKRKVEALKDVKGCHKVSVRTTGKRSDVSVHVSLDGRLSFQDVHRVASNVEGEVRRVLPKAKVTVRTEPLGHAREDVRTFVKKVADWFPGSRGVHNIHVQKIDGKLCVDAHLEVSANMTVRQAHEISDQIEKKLRAANPNISEITIHAESASGDRISRELNEDDTELKWYIERAAKRYNEIRRVHGIKIRRAAAGRHLVFRCQFEPNVRMKRAYGITIDLEKTIKAAYPDIARIDIHEEPA